VTVTERIGEDMAGGARVAGTGYDGGTAAPVGPRFVHRRRWPKVLLVLLLLFGFAVVGGYFSLDSRLHRTEALFGAVRTDGKVPANVITR
jgi:hypothetical protein